MGNKKSSKSEKSAKTPAAPLTAAELFRLPDGPVNLAKVSTERAAGGPADKQAAAAAMPALAEKLAGLQEKLYAQAIGGDRRGVLVVLQAMDTAGKDGIIEKVIGLCNPAGIKLTSFKRPTQEELAHDFLWRIERQVPAPGYIGVFNRSHYEDVLVQRVHNIVPKEIWSKRYATINAFERKLDRSGISIVKVFLHISKQVQAERLADRLDDPTKYWKFNPGDIDERGYWDAYQEAYGAALQRCSTVAAPWHVIPSDHKWYRNWAVAALLAQTLENLAPQYPAATFDVGEQRARLAASLKL